MIAPAGRLVYVPRQFQRQLRVIKLFRPRILIEGPDHRPAFADDSADAVEQDRLGIGKVMENEPDRPLARSVTPSELVVAQLKVCQRVISCCFKSRDDVHFNPAANLSLHSNHEVSYVAPSRKR